MLGKYQVEGERGNSILQVKLAEEEKVTNQTSRREKGQQVEQANEK
jgi:hypothetical protein